MKTPAITFILPKQPKPNDTRPRNAFGILRGFGCAYAVYYNRRDTKKP